MIQVLNGHLLKDEDISVVQEWMKKREHVSHYTISPANNCISVTWRSPANNLVIYMFTISDGRIVDVQMS